MEEPNITPLGLTYQCGNGVYLFQRSYYSPEIWANLSLTLKLLVSSSVAYDKIETLTKVPKGLHD